MKINLVNKKLIVLDRDGCINVPSSNKYITHVNDFEIYSDVIPFLDTILEKKIRVAIATNQQGIAKGLYSEEDVLEMHHSMLLKLKSELKDFPIYICPHFAGTCDCRKPSGKLLKQAILEANTTPSETVFIGDQETDFNAANDAEVDFIYLNRQLKIKFPGEYQMISTLSEYTKDMLSI